MAEWLKKGNLTLIALSAFVILSSPHLTINVDALPTTINVSTSAGVSERPQMASANGNIYVVWEDNTPGNTDIHFRRITNEGTTLGSKINLSQTSGESLRPRIAAYGTYVYIVWFDNSSGNNEIYFKKSTDSGATFENAINLSNTPGGSIVPRIATFDSNVYVVWQDENADDLCGCIIDIHYTVSTDYGTSFASVINLSNDGTSGTPVLEVSTSQVYVLWNSYNEAPTDFTGEVFTDPDGVRYVSDVYLASSQDRGQSFNAPINLSNNDGLSITPWISVHNQHVYIAWRDNTPGNNEILFRVSFDWGRTFVDAVNVSNNEGNSYYPYVAADTHMVYLVWWDDTPSNNPNPGMSDREILFTMSMDNGLTFYPVENLSTNDQESTYANMLAVGSNVYTSWYDANGGDLDVYYRKSTDMGQTFTDSVDVSWNTGQATMWYVPQMIKKGDYLYTLWDDNSNGNWDIYLDRMAEPFAIGNSFSTIEKGNALKRINGAYVGTVPFTVVVGGAYSCTGPTMNDLQASLSATITVEGITYQVTNPDIAIKDNAIKLTGTSPAGGEAFAQLFFPENVTCNDFADKAATPGASTVYLDMGPTIYAVDRPSTSGRLSFR